MKRDTEFGRRAAIVGVAAIALLSGARRQALADEPPTYNGPGGGEFTIERGDIKLVDGDGDWIIWGVGQDLIITEKKDGKGSLTLHNFGKITIKEKKRTGHACHRRRQQVSEYLEGGRPGRGLLEE